LSMSAPAIGQVKDAVRGTEAGGAAELASRALRCSTAEEVRVLLAGR
jgi:phosphoenolpyruvate-protein kinase (PTS system EI component)